MGKQVAGLPRDSVNLTSVGWAQKAELGKGRTFLSPAMTPTSSRACQDLPSLPAPRTPPPPAKTSPPPPLQAPA